MCCVEEMSIRILESVILSEYLPAEKQNILTQMPVERVALMLQKQQRRIL